MIRLLTLMLFAYLRESSVNQAALAGIRRSSSLR